MDDFQMQFHSLLVIIPLIIYINYNFKFLNCANIPHRRTCKPFRKSAVHNNPKPGENTFQLPRFCKKVYQSKKPTDDMTTYVINYISKTLKESLLSCYLFAFVYYCKSVAESDKHEGVWLTRTLMDSPKYHVCVNMKNVNMCKYEKSSVSK